MNLMLDFLKLLTIDYGTMNSLKNNPLLTWSKSEETLDFDNETINTKTMKMYKGILFAFYDKKLEILFKPHYYHNNNLHNANDFSVHKCMKIISEFRDLLNIELEKFRIINIEFGINIVSPVEIEKLITWIKFHSKNQFFNHSGLRYSKQSQSVSKSGRYSNYKAIKAYAKGFQFPQYSNRDTFRFEIKSKTSQYISGVLNIYTLDDLLDYEVYEYMGHELMKEFSEILILDKNVKMESLSRKEQYRLHKYLDVDVWERYTNNSINVYRNNFKKFHDLLDKTGMHLKKQVQLLLQEKIEMLKKCEVLTAS